MTNITNALFEWARQLPAAGLYSFIFAWLFIESTGFPISDEPLLLLAGYLSTLNSISLVPAIGIALVGKVSASCVAYWLGSRITLSTLARPSETPVDGWQKVLFYLRPTRALTDATEEQFRQRGVWGVFLGRLIPVVRSFISYPAGAARMPFSLFLLATTAGSLLWITIWTVLGMLLGRSYQAAAARWGSLSWLVLAAFILMLVGVWFWQHRHRPDRASDQG